MDGIDFTVKPGAVTGFLGPNGAGKSTTMRMIIGLDAPTAGTVTVNGRRYAQHAAPLHEVGALLEAKSIHPGRSAFDHLMALAYTHGISKARVTEVIELAGLQSVARKRAGAFSLGMGPAARDRGGAAGGSADGDARRTGERARPRGGAVGAEPAHRAGR